MKKFILGAFADEAGDDIDSQIEALHANNVPLLELRLIHGEHTSSMKPADAKELKKKLDANDVKIWSMGTNIGKIGIKDDFKPHLELFKNTVEISQIFGAECIRMFSFFIPEGDDPAIYRDEVMERLLRFAEVAKGTGLTLCHENEKAIYGDTALRCKDICDTLPMYKAIFDPANFIQCHQETLPAWEIMEPYIKYMHIKDCIWDGDVVPAGKGDGHLPELLAKYEKIGGEKLTLEPHLTVFNGLSSMEREGDTSKVGENENFVFPDRKTAFAAAVKYLRDIIEK